jgi:hypothetical protein
MRIITTTIFLGLTLLLTICCFEDFDERCQRESIEYTVKHCPRRMDEHTIMDSMVYDINTRTLNYHYTIEGLLDSDSVMTPKACNTLEENIKSHIINSVDLKIHKDRGINFCYCYHSQSTGKIRARVTVTKDDYAQ